MLLLLFVLYILLTFPEESVDTKYVQVLQIVKILETRYYSACVSSRKFDNMAAAKVAKTKTNKPKKRYNNMAAVEIVKKKKDPII